MKKILILDFGIFHKEEFIDCFKSLNAECKIVDHTISVEEIIKENPAGIILSGSSDHVYDVLHRECDREILAMAIPILGVCYGHQLIHHFLGGKVERKNSEFGLIETKHNDSDLFKDVPEEFLSSMSHYDQVTEMAPGFIATSYTDDCMYASSENTYDRLYTVQFHPERPGFEYGIKILENFVNICE